MDEGDKGLLNHTLCHVCESIDWGGTLSSVQIGAACPAWQLIHAMGSALYCSCIPALRSSFMCPYIPIGHDSVRVIMTSFTSSGPNRIFKHVPLARWIDHAEPRPIQE